MAAKARASGVWTRQSSGRRRGSLGAAWHVLVHLHFVQQPTDSIIILFMSQNLAAPSLCIANNTIIIIIIIIIIIKVATSNQQKIGSEWKSERPAVPHKAVSIYKSVQASPTWVSSKCSWETKTELISFRITPRNTSLSNMPFRCDVFDPAFNQSRIALNELGTLVPD